MRGGEASGGGGAGREREAKVDGRQCPSTALCSQWQSPLLAAAHMVGGRTKGRWAAKPRPPTVSEGKARGHSMLCDAVGLQHREVGMMGGKGDGRRMSRE